MSYREYQEAGSAAIASLLRLPVPPSGDNLGWALACRDQLLLSITERMEHLGADARGHFGRSHAGASLSERPLLHLSRLVAELPRVHIDVSPSDVLRTHPDDPNECRRLWQSAARSVFLATTELIRADDQPWLHEQTAAWPLVADLADMVEAVVLMDLTLAHRGAPGLLTPRRAANALLIAGDVGRIARLSRGDPVADNATASLGASRMSEHGVTLVRRPSDFATAELRLAAMVHNVRRYVDPGLPEERPGLRVARTLAIGQVRITHESAQVAASRGEDSLEQQFTAQIAVWRELHAASVRMVDTVRRHSTLPVLQQAEITTQLRVQGLRSLSTRQLSELAGSSHRVATELGRSLRGEVFTTPHLHELVAVDDGLPVARPIGTRDHPFYLACKGLAALTPPATSSDDTNATTGRRTLRQTLDARPWPGPSSVRAMSLRLR